MWVGRWFVYLSWQNLEQISWIDPCDNGTGAMKDGRFRALSSDLEYWSGHRGRKIQYDGSRTPEFNLKDIQKRPRWEFIGVWGILHTLIAVIRFEEPRVKLNGLEAGSLYFFQANFFDQQITVMWRGTRGIWVPVSARCGLRTHKAAAIGVSGRKADAEAEKKEISRRLFAAIFAAPIWCRLFGPVRCPNGVSFESWDA